MPLPVPSKPQPPNDHAAKTVKWPYVRSQVGLIGDTDVEPLQSAKVPKDVKEAHNTVLGRTSPVWLVI